MFGFSKSVRLRKRIEFTKLSERSRKLVTEHFVILAGASPDNAWARLGVTVSKKIGNAVTRNRIKRLVREFFRTNRDRFPTADYNIIARSRAGTLRYSAVSQELANALSRIGQRNNP